jgi:hypothetical protein
MDILFTDHGTPEGRSVYQYPHPLAWHRACNMRQRCTFILACALAKAERRAVYAMTLSEKPPLSFCGPQSHNETSEKCKKHHGSLLQNDQTPAHRKI